MINTEMLARMRTLLDEVTEVLYNDNAELYPALSLAQLEVCKTVADAWHEKQDGRMATGNIPLAVQGLLVTESNIIATNGDSTVIAANPLQVVSVQWQSDGGIVDGSPYAVELSQDLAGKKIIQNSLLSGGIYFHYADNLLTVNPVSTNGSAEVKMILIAEPVDISSSVQPQSNSVAHDAIVERALWILLKDRETEQANLHLKLYVGLMQGVIK